MFESHRWPRYSAIVATEKFPGAAAPEGQRRVQIGEIRNWNLLQVAGFATTSAELGNALRAALNLTLPEKIGATLVADERQLLKTGPEQYWIISTTDDDVSSRLRNAVVPDIGVITSLSHSRTRFFVEGPNASRLLAAGIALDLHPDVFGVNTFALTSLHHTPVLLQRIGPERYELLAMRTFAQWLWGCLADAALSYGYNAAAR